MAATFALIGLLCLSNALWFYNWRVRAVQHYEQIEALKAKRSYLGPLEPSVQVGRIRISESRSTTDRPLGRGEECRGGVIVRRNGTSLESTGEPCSF